MSVLLNYCPVCTNPFTDKTFFTQKYNKLINNETDFDVCITQCEKCGFIYQNPRPSGEKLENYYNTETFSVAYERGTKDIPETTYNRFVRVEKFWNDSNTIPTGKVLDLGTHTGQFLYFLKKKNYNCEGIEISKKAAEAGRKWYDVNITVGNIYELDKLFQKETYQFITLFHLLEHLTDFPSFFKNINYILKQDGILNIEVPDILRMKKNYVNYFYIEHISYFSLYTLDFLLKRYGYEKLNGEQIPSEYPDDHGEEMPSIIVVYKKTGKTEFNTNSIKISNDVLTKFQEVILKLNQKVDYIKNILNQLKSYKNVYIWGSGSHTHFLKGLNEISNAKAVLDSNSNKWGKKIFGLPIISPQDAKNEITNEDVILISSYSGELSIFNAAKELFPNNIAIKLYN